MSLLTLGNTSASAGLSDHNLSSSLGLSTAGTRTSSLGRHDDRRPRMTPITITKRRRDLVPSPYTEDQ